ncbi:thiosulfate oxidation carrier protein SoxY [Usitatibacter palustris]|uniref:Ig-like SoxY domain-containing protein n=1 Tax=Usitatibacter palustris TaxID=2732487 RepID=A0A6M4HBN0_9PROT|nr:thiosulfate oxidation carrier protein SoxY [Usitatibacter palustris]QJR16023.1 hypothetical protein DSM104440_02851 [Usitatibacter palustris]
MKRRSFLAATGAALAGASLPASAQRFQPAQDITPLIEKITGGKKPEDGGIKIDLPAIAENGNSVPMGIQVESPMTEADHVAAIHILAERNPRPQIAVFHFSPASGRAQVDTRVRLAGTQKVTVIASLSGGRFRMARVDVLVTSAACLDEATLAT